MMQHEFEIDDKSILAQMERVTDAQYKLENEMDELRKMILSTKVKEKGIPKNQISGIQGKNLKSPVHDRPKFITN